MLHNIKKRLGSLVISKDLLSEVEENYLLRMKQCVIKKQMTNKDPKFRHLISSDSEQKTIPQYGTVFNLLLKKFPFKKQQTQVIAICNQF